MSQIETAKTVAEALVKIRAVGTDVHHPTLFKSGILSPVYIDNRQVPFHPQEWKVIIKGFSALINELSLTFDV